MAREQQGICAEPNLHGLLLLMHAVDGHQQAIRKQLGKLPALINRLTDQFSEANLNAVVAVGAGYWDELYPTSRPAQFGPFNPLAVDDVLMPAVPYDVLLYVRSDRYDVLHLAVQQCYQLLAPHLELVEQTHCFRFMDGRDLTGFIDQPSAPRGRLKRELALLPDSGQPEHAQGSYVHYQRYRLDLARWQQLSQMQQEQIVGQLKLDGQRLPSAQLNSQSHAAKADPQRPDGSFYPLVYQNMPFGQLKAQGMVVVAFSSEPDAYPQHLQRRLGEPGAQNYDLLLDYVQADSGAAFFAPSVSFLEDMAACQV